MDLAPPSTLITGADRGLGFALTQAFLARGWRVLAGQYLPEWPDLSRLAEQYPALLTFLPLDVSDDASVRATAQAAVQTVACIDLLVNNAGVNSPTTRRDIREPQDYPEMQRLYNVNALGALRVVEAFLPLVERSQMKRLCFVSSEAGSIARSERTAWYGYCMSKAALNMAVKILFNHLRPEGFTFRLYHPGWLQSYMSGKQNLQANLPLEAAAAKALPFFLDQRPDEDRLALVDYDGNEWPW
jgi:NAD(P)-dependent dehydrogenase (short-subunit alcohol dehydrogenase family)